MVPGLVHLGCASEIVSDKTEVWYEISRYARILDITANVPPGGYFLQ